MMHSVLLLGLVAADAIVAARRMVKSKLDLGACR